VKSNEKADLWRSGNKPFAARSLGSVGNIIGTNLI
jgi:hypothetical protein